MTITVCRSARAAAFLVAVLLVPLTVSAQPVAVLERKLLPFRFDESLKALPSRFWDALTFVREEEDRQRSLRADISFGLSGDEAGDQSLFRVNTGINLARGVFPSEVSVASRVFLQLRNGQLQEDITILQITYDYHSDHHVEYFAFAERFSDTFLSIQQRYEIGFGARTGVEFGRSSQWRGTDATFDVVDAGLTQVEAALPAVRRAMADAGVLPGSPHDVAAGDLASFRTTMHDLRHALAYRQTTLFLGIAASLFSEIESAFLDVTVLPVAGSGRTDAPTRNRVSIGSQQRYRVSVRPTFRWRPSRDVSISVFPYFKIPFDGPRHVILPSGERRLDYRRDILSEASWTVRREQTGLESAELVFTFNHFYDSVPPALPPSLIAERLASGLTFDRTVAENRHRVTALNLRLRW